LSRRFLYDWDLRCLALKDVEGGVVHVREVEGAAIFAAVLAKAQIERPMQIVFDAPMGAYGGEKSFGVG
jgi:hypothetical protein